VATVVYAPNALRDLERAIATLHEVAPEVVGDAIGAITSAIAILEHHPLIGRPVGTRLRELVISFGKTGYVALYRFVPARHQVRILAVRHQRELDYPE
jgi:plasmid stabilization system protein ParE